MLILDGAMGTELAARGLATPAPMWSASAIASSPEEIGAIHRDYAAAGATVHTAATFRATRRAAGAGWEALARRAVAIARGAVPASHRVAGSVAPLEDCYRPDLSPRDRRVLREEHGAVARVLADAGVDLLLCETFPLAREAVAAVEACVATGRETWIALTAGPSGDLLTSSQMEDAARACVDAGARAVLVNCVAASLTLPYVTRLSRLAVPFGAYANDWGAARDDAAASRYITHALTWIDAGATLLGGCCGTSPSHITALASALH